MSFLVNKVPKNPNHVGTQWQVQYPKFCPYAGLTNSLEQSFKYNLKKNKKNQTQPKPPQLTCIRNTQEIFYILSKPKYQNC